VTDNDFDEAGVDEDPLGDLDDLPQSRTEQVLRRVLDLVESARPVPLSTSAMINKEEIAALLQDALAAFPEELRESRWLLKQRTEFLDKARADGDELVTRARARAEQMVQRTEVVRAAEYRARQLVEDAQAQARRTMLACDDYCDKKLGSFEIVLERTAKLVAQGRERLQLSSSRLADPFAEGDVEGETATRPGRDESSGLFDQDLS